MRLTDTMIRGIGMTSQRTRERLVSRLREKGIVDSRVLDIILQTPRHLFVDEALASRAYEDTALPIGYGQTISQPYIVARMTELLLGGGGGAPQRVLEIGTGCGYQTTVLAQLVKDVFTVERIEALQQQARQRFRRLGLRNVRSRHTDGQWGWSQHAPFDGMLVTAAPEIVPEELLGQLNVGGRMVIPVGTARRQHLSVVTRTESEYIQDLYEPVSFVPLLGGEI